MANTTSNRGFASMDEAKQREIARKGGASVPANERSFSRDHELAAAAGRKGGASVPDEKRSFSQNHDLASEAGRKGGQMSGGNLPTIVNARPRLDARAARPRAAIAADTVANGVFVAAGMDSPGCRRKDSQRRSDEVTTAISLPRPNPEPADRGPRKRRKLGPSS